MKLTVIVLSAIAGIFLIGLCCVMSSQNGAISLEESVKTAKSGIDVQLANRFNKLTELAECVKNYDAHEYRTLTDTIAARGKNMNGKEVRECLAAFSRVEERYPELRSQSNYKMLMEEISIVENHLAQHKKAFNEYVRDYNRYCRKFPTSMLLSIVGYDFIKFEYYRAEESMVDTKPMKLF